MGGFSPAGSHSFMGGFSPINGAHSGVTNLRGTPVGSRVPARGAAAIGNGAGGNRSTLMQHLAARSGATLPATTGPISRTLGNAQSGAPNSAVNTVARVNNAAVAAQQLNALGNGLGGFGSRNFNYWGANSLGLGYGNGFGFGAYGNRGFGYGNGLYGYNNGIYVLVYIPNVGWVLVPYSFFLSMGGLGGFGGIGGFGGLGGFGGGLGGLAGGFGMF
jgi:hypothetical protein